MCGVSQLKINHRTLLTDELLRPSNEVELSTFDVDLDDVTARDANLLSDVIEAL